MASNIAAAETLTRMRDDARAMAADRPGANGIGYRESDAALTAAIDALERVTAMEGALLHTFAALRGLRCYSSSVSPDPDWQGDFDDAAETAIETLREYQALFESTLPARALLQPAPPAAEQEATK